MLLDKHERGDTAPFAGGVSALQFTTAVCDLRRKKTFVSEAILRLRVGRCCVELHYGIVYLVYSIANCCCEGNWVKNSPQNSPTICNLRQHRSSLTAPHFNMADVALLYSEDKKCHQKKRRG